MEPETISKNGARPKIHTNRINLFATLLLLLSAFAFTGRDKDNDDPDTGGNPVIGKTGPITIAPENGDIYNDLIDEVRLIYGDDLVAGSAAYTDGRFTIDLPASVPDKYRYSIESTTKAPAGAKWIVLD
ncbi:MAG: hypothetical protein LBK65_08940 [Tannerellaceae bacterium]|jgi:hypothetical protein|nr:hypothetical protein [Tannerellaceae bacterium]